MNQPLVYVVVLAWNYKDYTLECLGSTLQMDYGNLRTLVVDNGSTDGTRDAVSVRFPQTEIVHSDSNLGIAGGYNLGIQYALGHQADYILVTNNDVIMDREMLREAVAAAEHDEQVGIILPKIYYHDIPDRIWCAGARWRPFPPEFKRTGLDRKDGPQYSQMHEITCAPSCTLLIKRQAFEKAGLFDPGYFFYYDDWDFTERVHKSGFRLLFAPTAKIWHRVSVSTQKSDKPARWWFVLGQSSVRFHLAHRSPLILFTHNLWFILREIIKLKPSRLIPYIAGVVNGHARHRGWIVE